MKESLEIFNIYYQNFDDNIYKIHKKYNHTFRVIEYAKKISKSLNLPKEDYDLACQCALFHDIARFKQWTLFQTYEDDLSFDHGNEGYNILKELGISNKIILLSTKYHNKYALPTTLDKRTKLFIDITRDADKIDIMDKQARTFKDKNIVLNKEIINCFINHKVLKNSYINTSLSLHIMLRTIALIFDINYIESLKIIKEKNIINIKFNEILSKIDNEEIRKFKDICNKYIEERLSE